MSGSITSGSSWFPGAPVELRQTGEPRALRRFSYAIASLQPYFRPRWFANGVLPQGEEPRWAKSNRILGLIFCPHVKLLLAKGLAFLRL
jgi:hypothetical protein